MEATQRQSGMRIASTTKPLAGRVLALEGRLALYRIKPPLQLATHLGAVYPDGWMSEFRR
jgi:hypothetical protein